MASDEDILAGTSLDTPRARQLRHIGREMTRGGGLMAEEMMAEIIGTLEQWFEGYTDPLGDGVQRRIDIEDSDEESITFAVRLERYAEPQHRYRLRLSLEELNT